MANRETRKLDLSLYTSDMRYCYRQPDKQLRSCFEDVVREQKIGNIFNPSFYLDEVVQIFAYRAIRNGQTELSSYISIEDRNGRTIRELHAGDYAEFGVPRFIDPKVIALNNEYYVTFNSGWVESGNDIFIMKIYPEYDAPRRVLYKGRQTQERNWAFFSKHGQVYALYWINPLKILRLRTVSPDTWEMEEYFAGENRGNLIPEDLTVGTQLSGYKGKYYFMAHKKEYINEKKIYFGRLCEFDGDRKTVCATPGWYAHSPRSLLGSSIKHNTNLHSCTYFSGMQVVGDKIKVGYGVNDVDCGFSSFEISEL